MIYRLDSMYRFEIVWNGNVLRITDASVTDDHSGARSPAVDSEYTALRIDHIFSSIFFALDAH